MRRLGAGGFDAVAFEGFEGLRHAANQRLEPLQFARLLDDDLIELLHLPLQVSDVGLQSLDLIGYGSHEIIRVYQIFGRPSPNTI